MKEASKTKIYFGVLENQIFKGKGIDIGCGNDPIFADIERFDISDGDANNICKYVKKQFDFVFSSHCLEHMKNPFHTIQQWWTLVKENGYLYIIVPDEDLYEHGHFPSKHNSEHKWTFTLLKQKETNIRSINIIELFSSLKDARILKIEVQDNNYNYNLKEVDQTLGSATAQICCCLQKNKAYQNINFLFKNSLLQKLILLINCFFINSQIMLEIMCQKAKRILFKK